MGPIDNLEVDLAHARRVAEARAAFDAARAGRPERWAPAEARDKWERVVREVVEARGGGRGAYVFVGRAGGVGRDSVWRALHGRGGDQRAA